MSNQSTVIESLRSSRRAEDTLSRLQQKSIEGINGRIAEALALDDWAHGPAKLQASFGDLRYVLATNARGDAIRVAVSEGANGEIILGKMDLFESAVPAQDMVSEVMESAKAAVSAIIEGEDATDLLKPMVSAFDVSGDLHRRIQLEMDLRGVVSESWYSSVLAIPASEIETGLAESVEEDEIGSAVDRLQDILVSNMSAVRESVEILRDRGETSAVKLKAAEAIIEDFARAMRVVRHVNRTDSEEMIRVYESVAGASPQMIAGARFLTQLAGRPTHRGEE